MFTGIAQALDALLRLLHAGLEPVTGAAAWGWAVILLTVLVRLLLLPLAVRQFHGMQRMQALQPQVAQLRQRYTTSREMARTDPERDRRRKQKLNEELTELYRREGVNPASGCLPLLIQAPLFIALLRVLRTSPHLKNASFYAFTAGVAATAQYHGLGTPAREAGTGGLLLVALMFVTGVATQRTMRTARSVDTSRHGAAAWTTWGMPAFLVVVSIGFPIGVLLYWVTSSTWQWGQQLVLLRRLEAPAA